MEPAVQFDGQAAAEFLTSRIDYERATAVTYDPRDFCLDRMRELLDRLGNPQRGLPIIHIAGTKGKGSTAAMIASILRAAGFHTGLYSSPHLDSLEERLMVDGAICPADELVGLVNRVRPVVAAMDDAGGAGSDGSKRPTYFEIVTALALLRFALCRVDAAVLEVGMGGRLDSTNVCDPLVSVITNISFDHTQQLGNTLAAIAREKAGIIKPDTPVVSGVLSDEPRRVVAEVARAQGCRLVQLGQDFDYTYRPPRNLNLAATCGHMDFHTRTPGDECDLRDIELRLIGAHQAANAAVGIASLVQLRRRGWNIPQAAIRQGLVEFRWPARIEVLRRNPTVVLDAAHNVASVEALARVLDESFSAARRVLVFATTRDKDLSGMLQVLIPRFDEVIFTRYRNNPRGVAAEELDALARRFSPGGGHVCADPTAAWDLASRLARREDLICITGSFFIAAEMRAAIGQSAT